MTNPPEMLMFRFHINRQPSGRVSHSSGPTTNGRKSKFMRTPAQAWPASCTAMAKKKAGKNNTARVMMTDVGRDSAAWPPTAAPRYPSHPPNRSDTRMVMTRVLFFLISWLRVSRLQTKNITTKKLVISAPTSRQTGADAGDGGRSPAVAARQLRAAGLRHTNCPAA